MLTINGLVGCATAVFYLINRSVLLKNLINLHRALAAKASVFCMAIFVASGAQGCYKQHSYLGAEGGPQDRASMDASPSTTDIKSVRFKMLDKGKRVSTIIEVLEN